MNRKIGVVLSFLSIAIEIVSAIFLTPFLIRKFGQSEYGVYTLVLSITSYLALLDLGIGNSVVRFVSSFKTNNQIEELKKFEGIVTVFYLIICFITLVVGLIIIIIFPYAFSKGLSEEEILLSQKLLMLTTANVAITLGTSGFVYTIVGFEKFIISKGLPIIATFTRIVVSFVVLNNGGTSLAITATNLIINSCARLFFVFYVLFVIRLRPKFRGIEKSRIKSVLLFSTFIFLQMIATQINSMVDNILIGALVADASIILAVYGVAATIKQYLSTFGGAVNGVLMPGVVKRVEKGINPQEIEKEMIRIGRIVFMLAGAIFCGFCVFGDWFVTLWAGSEYSDAYYAAIVLMFAYVLILTQSVGTQFLWAKNEHKEQAIIKFAIVILNIGLTILLIQWNPLFGAVIGTFISLIVGDVILSLVVFKMKLKIGLFSYFAGIIKGIVPSLLISTVFSFLYKLANLSGWFGLILGIVVFLFVFLICMAIFGFSKNEKKYIKDFLKIKKE